MADDWEWWCDRCEKHGTAPTERQAMADYKEHMTRHPPQGPPVERW